MIYGNYNYRLLNRGEKLRLTTKSRYGARADFDIPYHSLGLPVQTKDIRERQKIIAHLI